MTDKQEKYAAVIFVITAVIFAVLVALSLTEDCGELAVFAVGVLSSIAASIGLAKMSFWIAKKITK